MLLTIAIIYAVIGAVLGTLAFLMSAIGGQLGFWQSLGWGIAFVLFWPVLIIGFLWD